jgi:hypothetical protein
MRNELLDIAIEAAGGLDLWNRLRALSVDVSIGGPIWASKGWLPDETFDQIVTVDTSKEHIVFNPFIRPDQRLTFDAATDSVTLETLDGQLVDTMAPARAAFKGYLLPTPFYAQHLGYFLGYACWNYFNSPFLFQYPGVESEEIEPWQEAGQTWRRLRVHFPPSLPNHSPDQVFYFDAQGLQRRMDYVAEVIGSSLVGHYTSRYQSFGGLQVPTRRRVFRRRPDNTVDLNLPAITVDIRDVKLHYTSDNGLAK